MSEQDRYPLPSRSTQVAPSDLVTLPFHRESEREGLGLWDCWLTIRKRAWLVISAICAMLILTYTIILLDTPLFTATATLLIQFETPQVLNVVHLVATAPNSEEHDFYKTQEDLLRSPSLAASVIRASTLQQSPLLKPDPSPAGPIGSIFVSIAELVTWLQYPHLSSPELTRDRLGVESDVIRRYLRMLSITPVVGTQLVTVSFTSADPILSARIANAHAHAYVAWGLELRHQASTSTQDFLRSQLVTIKTRVEQSEAALNSYRHNKGIVSFAIDDKDQIAEARMAALAAALTEAQTNRIRLEADMQLVRQGDYDSLPQVVANPMIQAVRPQIDQLASQYAAMSNHFTDHWPDLAKLKAELSDARMRLNQEVATVTKAIGREYQEAAVREQGLQQALAAEKESDLTRNDAALQDAVLAREVETNRQLYEDVLRRMQEMGVAEQGPLSNVTIITNATPPNFRQNRKYSNILASPG
jgi:uncharacterized protein involved in exopolysaccharide biosynthesis